MKKVVLIFLIFICSESHSASFDCKKATSLSEIMICNDALLSQMDDELGFIYNEAKKVVPDKQHFEKQSAAIWQWREKNCQTKQCLITWFDQRKISLEKVIKESRITQTKAELSSSKKQTTGVVTLKAPSAPVRKYEVPPSSITSTNVPWISDAQMEVCVRNYNESKWMAEEIRKLKVDNYSQASVDAYNKKVGIHSNMLDYFNKHCAGKQSESAYRAVTKTDC